MTKRIYRKLAILAKVAPTYGADAAPTGAANAMVMTDVTLRPMEGESVSRDLYLPYLGHQGEEFVATHARLEGSVEFAGAGAAGAVPAYAPLLRACGMAQTVSAGVKVDFDPASDNVENATIYCNLDGVNHIMLGVRGTWTLSVTPRQIPRIRFQLWGLLGPIADTPLPALTTTIWKRPITAGKTNTPTLTLHGLTNIVAESVEINNGNQVEPRFLIGSESIEIVDRKMTGTIVCEARSLATKNWFAIAEARTRGPLQLIHGTTPGNILEVTGPALEIGRPTYGQTQGITNQTLPVMFCPDTGDDEFRLTVR